MNIHRRLALAAFGALLIPMALRLRASLCGWRSRCACVAPL